PPAWFYACAGGREYPGQLGASARLLRGSGHGAHAATASGYSVGETFDTETSPSPRKAPMDILSSTLAAGGRAASESPIPLRFMISSSIAVVAILLFDLLLVGRRPHVPSMREAGIWVGFYVALALVFAASLFAIGDAQHGSEFLTGWLLEYSLSIDNLFVFIIIM